MATALGECGFFEQVARFLCAATRIEGGLENEDLGATEEEDNDPSRSTAQCAAVVQVHQQIVSQLARRVRGYFQHCSRPPQSQSQLCCVEV